jgi:ADP-ribose pyrophosphatase YjhB (NUDIX family)
MYGLQREELSSVIDLQRAKANTAGAYVCLDGYYPFAIGIQPHNGHIPIVRLGGHCEEQETGWQCAVREVYEETNLHIEPLRPHATYLSDWDHREAELREIGWQVESPKEPVPLLIVTHQREEEILLSLMYLAHAEGIPTPSSEVKGLLLLEKEEVHLLCQERLTLKQYLSRGGKASLNAAFDTSLVLEPFAQLRYLSQIFSQRDQRSDRGLCITTDKINPA